MPCSLPVVVPGTVRTGNDLSAKAHGLTASTHEQLMVDATCGASAVWWLLHRRKFIPEPPAVIANLYRVQLGRQAT